METDDLLARVRALALALPEATERVSHGSPSWFIGTSPMFATFADHHHGSDDVALWVAAPEGRQGEHVAADPELWFVPPYVGTRGWVGLRLDALHDRTDGASDSGWDLVADALEEAWAHVAPARLRDRR